MEINPLFDISAHLFQKFRFHSIFLALFFLLFLSGCGFSLAGDVAPPANYKEPAEVVSQPTAANTVFPLVAPDPEQGAEIYSEKCAACHGETGMGDGVMVPNLSYPPSPLGNAELARKARPVDWYAIVTEGNLEKFMPGFASLSDRQRWDVVAYALTLSTKPDEIAEGKSLYEANCSSCHGLSGAGDGVDSASQAVRPAAWNDQERLVNLSAEDIARVMAGEKEDHPSFAEQTDQAQRFAVAAYIRTLSFSTTGRILAGVESNPPAADTESENNSSTEAILAAPASITISGKVSNDSPGGVVPPGLTVVISAYQGMNPAFNVTGEVNADGTYQVDEVAFSDDYVYFAQVEVNGVIFNSDILHAGDITGAAADLPVKIYDVTTDPEKLRADRLHIFLDFNTPGKMQVVNLYIISNLGERVVVPAQTNGTVIDFELPVGAENLQFQDGELGGRFLETESGFGDRLSIAPGMGQHQVLFAYDLPYNRKLKLEMRAPLPVDALIVMVPPGEVMVKSAQMIDAGQRDVQGMSFQMYQSAAGLNRGETLALELSGNVSFTGAAGSSGTVSSLLIGILGFGLAVAAGGVWLYRTRRGKVLDNHVVVEPFEEVEDTSESLVDAIVTLDDLHAAGDLPEDAYQARRAELKYRLAETLKREQ